MLHKFYVLLGFVFLSWNSFAQEVYKDWTLIEEESNPILQTAVCQAFTEITTPQAPVSLHLIFPKEFSKAPIAVVHVDPSLQAKAVLIKTAAKVIEPALPVSFEEQDGIYWYVPTDMDRIVKKISQALQLEVVIVNDEGELPLNVSLAGSQRTLQNTRKCVSAKSQLYVEKFFKDLTDPKAEALPVEGDLSLKRAFDFFQNAYSSHWTSETAKADLDRLRRDHRNIIQEEKKAWQAADVANQNRNKAQEALSKNESEQTLGRETIQQSQKRLTELDSKKVSAEDQLARKKQIYDPLLKESQQYTAQINAAQKSIDNANGRIRTLNNQISSAQSQIQDLRNEASRLESQVRDNEREISRLDHQRFNAENRHRNYDVEFEARQILQRDFRYRQAQTDLQRGERELDQARHQLRRAQSDLQTARQNLQSCMRDPNKDCSQERNAEMQAQREVERASQNENQARRQIQRAQDQIRQSERNARDEAQRQKQLLANELNNILRNIQNLESKNRKAGSRIRSIFDYEIPQRNQTIQSAENEIPRQRRALQQGQEQLRTAQTEYDSFKSRTNFDAVKSEFLAAEQALQNIVSEIKGLQRLVTEQNQKIEKLLKAHPTLKKDLESKQKIAAEKEDLLKEVRERMTDFKTRESQLQSTQELMWEQFQQFRGMYKTIVNAVTRQRTEILRLLP